MSESKPMAVTLLRWKSIRKGSLIGFADVQVGALEIHGVSVMMGQNGAWAACPSKPRIGRDGSPIKNENGKATYEPIVKWATREAGDRFTAGVIAAINEKHPGEIGE